jgi:hypothetical protein
MFLTLRGRAKQTVLEAGQASYLLQNNEINGYPFEMSNHIPSNLTKVLLLEPVRLFCLDFSKLVIGQWGFMDLSVDDKSRKKRRVYRDHCKCVFRCSLGAYCFHSKDVTTA